MSGTENTTAEVTREEARALQEVAGERSGDPEVAERDFRRPRRLSAGQLEELERLVQAGLPAAALGLQARLAPGASLELASLGETDAGSLAEGLEEAPIVLRFLIGGHPAWLVWESRAAVAACELLLGSGGGEVEERALTAIEAHVLGELLEELAGDLTAPLGLKPGGDAQVVQERDSLGTWRDGPDGAQPHRVALELALTGPWGASTVRLLLPGLHDGPPTQGKGDGRALPAHPPGALARVELELRARFGSGEVSLDQLLRLEEGDVIPIDARVGDPLRIHVEDRGFARAELGTHRGRLAVRIQGFETKDEDER